MTCEIPVLGPVSLPRDGVEVDAGHSRQRTPLAILTARVGDPDQALGNREESVAIARRRCHREALDILDGQENLKAERIRDWLRRLESGSAGSA